MFRVSLVPLLEENSNNIEDGEITVNRITGHLSIKNNGEFVSKTKELEGRSIILGEDIKYLSPEYKDLKKRTDDAKAEAIKIDARLDAIETVIAGLEQREVSLKALITQLENSNESHYKRTDSLYGRHDKTSVDIFKNSPPIIDLERQFDEFKYFKGEIDSWFSHIETRRNGDLATYHTKNRNELNRRVYKQEFIDYKNYIEGLYSALGASYTVQGFE